MSGTSRRLGELVLRSQEPEKLVAFYQDVMGFDLFAKRGDATFLKVADDLEGHPQLLAIFDALHTFSGPESLVPDEAGSGRGTLHHFAFALEYADFVSEQQRLQASGIAVRTAEHRTFGWRSLYLYDPDGNSVELVCYDPSLLEQAAGRTGRA